MSSESVQPADASAAYAAFMPAKYRNQLAEPPESSFWQWQGNKVHVLRRPNESAPVRLIVVHGLGAHAAALWPFAAVLPQDFFDLTAVDMPLYGWTQTPSPASVRYQDWLDLLGEFVNTHDDGRPVILLGASIGGMLAYEVAEQTQMVDAVAATCLLDPRDRQARTPLTLVHPALDAWTPVSISTRWTDQMNAPTQVVLLPEAGHFPIEEPAVDQLLATLTQLGESVAAAGPS